MGRRFGTVALGVTLLALSVVLAAHGAGPVGAELLPWFGS